MIKSMTGYGRGETKGRFGVIKAEIKSLNNKFFDIVPRLPSSLGIFEDRTREYVQKKVKRGRVNLSVSYDEAPAIERKYVLLNKHLASAILKEIKSFGKEHSLRGEIDINQLMTLPGVITYESLKADTGELWSNLKRALDEAIRKMDESRISEGKRLSKDLSSRVGKIKKSIRAVEKSSSKSVEYYKTALSKKIKELSGGGVEIDRERLAQETALYAKNCDITEEITRIRSHIVCFEKSLASGGEKGKTLDFAAQELIREINTIGSKASDFTIARHVIIIKAEIEKIREQLKNIE